jgi:hypothetical protein
MHKVDNLYMSVWDAEERFPDKFILIRREDDRDNGEDRPPTRMCTVLYIGDDYHTLWGVLLGLEDKHCHDVILGEYYANVPGMLIPAPGCYWKMDKKIAWVTDDVSSSA